MATLWRLAEVMETASLRAPAVIEPEVRNTPSSGHVEEKTNSMCQAGNASAERAAVMAHNSEGSSSAGARSSKVQASLLHAAASAGDQEFRGPAPRAPRQPGIYQPLSKSLRASSAASSRLVLLSKALPNPSIKPSPNGKPPGPRYSAVHHLQRGPGVSPLVPAYVER